MSETAARILVWSSTKYSVHVNNTKAAIESIKLPNVKSLLEKHYFGELERYKMHRLIKFYFMDRGDQHDEEMEADFNSSFQIYFTDLRLRHRPLDEIREKVETELLSDYDRHNFYYLNELLLSSYNPICTQMMRLWYS